MDETERALHNLRIVLAKLRARDERKYVEVREEIIREHGHLRKSKMNA